ncbi:hypothetical protein CTI12_AA449650 [Artemisia annua]|uniref:Uncharacterized protein n=1 Tax=Artemisia annua TaxID=35608 RepID=A0A2U1LV93_ARTAN|nr:hypothetical protein CTI12_AA449650 [Artemisia annua]
MESDKVVTISPAHPQWGAYFSMMFCMIAIFNSLLQLVIRMLLPDPVPPPPAILIITPIASFALVALVTGILIFQHLFFQTWLTNFIYRVLKTIGLFSLMLMIYSMGVATIISFSLSSWILIPWVSLHLVLFIVGCYILWKQVCCYQPRKHYIDIHYPIMFCFPLHLSPPWLCDSSLPASNGPSY